jgi:hypothetical protein
MEQLVRGEDGGEGEGLFRNFQNWKAPGVDQIQNFWYNKLTYIHNNRRAIVGKNRFARY